MLHLTRCLSGGKLEYMRTDFMFSDEYYNVLKKAKGFAKMCTKMKGNKT